MGKFYGTKILNGSIAFEDVPKLWRNPTEKWMTENAAQ